MELSIFQNYGSPFSLSPSLYLFLFCCLCRESLCAEVCFIQSLVNFTVNIYDNYTTTTMLTDIVPTKAWSLIHLFRLSISIYHKISLTTPVITTFHILNHFEGIKYSFQHSSLVNDTIQRPKCSEIISRTSYIKKLLILQNQQKISPLAFWIRICIYKN